MNDEYKDRAYQIIQEMGFYLAHKGDKEKDNYVVRELKKIEKWIDCMDMIDKFKEIVKE